jgi:hypothetical protein
MTDKPLTFDHLRSRKKPTTTSVTIVLDPDLYDTYDAARRRRDQAQAQAAARPDDSEAAAQLWEAQDSFDKVERRLEEEEALAVFTFRSIGRKAYDDLVADHPPTKDQRLKAKASGLGDIAWNHDTFPPALVAASLVEPALDAEQMAALWADPNWNQAELVALMNAAIEVNGTRRTVEVGKDWRATRTSGLRSPTA